MTNNVEIHSATFTGATWSIVNNNDKCVLLKDGANNYKVLVFTQTANGTSMSSAINVP